MTFLIYTRDKADSQLVRDKYRAQHYEFLEAHKDRLLASGGIQNDEASQFVGAAIIADYDTLAEVNAFIERDPFYVAGLFEEIRIHRWKPAFLGGRRITG